MPDFHWANFGVRPVPDLVVQFFAFWTFPANVHMSGGWHGPPLSLWFQVELSQGRAELQTPLILTFVSVSRAFLEYLGDIPVMLFGICCAPGSEGGRRWAGLDWEWDYKLTKRWEMPAEIPIISPLRSVSSSPTQMMTNQIQRHRRVKYQDLLLQSRQTLKGQLLPPTRQVDLPDRFSRGAPSPSWLLVTFFSQILSLTHPAQ